MRSPHDLVCLVQHPDRTKGVRPHNNLIQRDFAFHYAPTGRAVRTWEEIHREYPERVCRGVRCPECKVITEYEIIAPGTEPPEITIPIPMPPPVEPPPRVARKVKGVRVWRSAISLQPA